MNKAILIIAGVVGVIVVFLVVRVIVLKEKALDTTSLIGIILTVLGIFFIILYNRLLKNVGIPANTEAITPSDLKDIINAQREKIKEDKLNELENRTPDDIIDNELPADSGNAIRTTIDNGKRKIRNLFYGG